MHSAATWYHRRWFYSHPDKQDYSQRYQYLLVLEIGSIDRKRGFTLIELLAVLSIIGILSTVVASSYSAWLQRTKSEQLMFDFQRSFSLAQSLAIKHGGRIHMCASEDAATCSGSLNQGWIIFLDADSSNQVNGTDTILRAFEYNTTVLQVLMKNSANSASVNGVSFNFKGYAEYPIEAEISGADATRKFDINRSGHIE